jgi:hypothetical protein
MKPIYVLNFGKGISRIINLRTVSSVYQYKNRITVTYNYPNSNGLLIFGSGFYEQTPHKDELNCENEEEAIQHIKCIELCMKNM